jgi:hypothetical protein
MVAWLYGEGSVQGRGNGDIRGYCG